ncbi:hypothetical protein MRX96_041697 [Rhipicephalus microplus]
MLSTWQKEPRPATYRSKPQHRFCTQEQPADQARRVPHLPPAHVPGQGATSSHKPVVQTSAADREQRWFWAPRTKGEKLPTEKARSHKKADSSRCHFRDARHPAEPVSVPGDRNSSQQQ